jgi:hypothetical protein
VNNVTTRQILVGADLAAQDGLGKSWKVLSDLSSIFDAFLRRDSLRAIRTLKEKLLPPTRLLPYRFGMF